MKNLKNYLAVSLWMVLCGLLSYQYYSQSQISFDEQKSISSTNQKIINLTKKLHKDKLERLDVYVNNRGNHKRDRGFYNRLQNNYSFVNRLYDNDSMNIKYLKPFLMDTVSVRLRTNNIKPTSNFKGLEDIYNTNLYQNVYELIEGQHYNLYGFDCGFFKVMTIHASDTTLGLYSTEQFFSSANVPKMDIKILNKEYPMVSVEGPIFSKKFTKPIIFQVNTHTDNGIISKKYKIKTKKHLQPFDYEEIK